MKGRKFAKNERCLLPSPGVLPFREAARCYWISLGYPEPGVKVIQGLNLAQLVEAVARASICKWGPCVGVAVSWAAELSTTEYEAWLSHCKNSFKQVATAPLDPSLHKPVLSKLIEAALRSVCDLTTTGEPGVYKGDVITSLEPLNLIQDVLAEGIKCGSGGGVGSSTPLLSGILKKGLPLPGRPNALPSHKPLPPCRETELLPTDVPPLSDPSLRKPVVAFSFPIPL